ncbi:chromosome segregation protein SMC [Silvanigrella paludirubra]|uniref:Chromosome partition protein Smc n=1 Tax=Silvanigrella paludirubra TaxID=2499159 RepID=A0A6N6VW78_9BACT|nr:chromosome segregation protein SMC [Silvanigrella paludirubra]KAB8040880.1 chromosome segregation protein SMC [Silvanigrella paludirubra]
MKLKSIHISGFKSFADRVNIHYHDGITGVIGPNGSGKSNIIDAVRWVMGEQTAKSLRADDPTDIIFSGSQDRKPLSLAEVTLIFSNDGLHCPAEYMHLPEISIGRRINRGGEREYFMNREPCRLKDIVDFLLSIGLGSKSYAIIQQDKRDRIIQASPEDLREILEETAGITVFKVRRKEAEKRLTSTSERIKNLAEIEQELTRQKESLSEQVEKASLKLSYSQELKEKEIELIKNHVGFYRSIASKIKKEVDSRSSEIQQSSLEANEWEATANDLKSTQLELTQQIKATENQLDDQKIALTKYQERRENYKKRHEERILQKDKIKKELAEEQFNLKGEEEKQNQLMLEVDKLGISLQKIDSEKEGFQERLEELDESLQVERMRGDEIRSEMKAIESSRNSLRARNESMLDTISRYNQQIQKVTENYLSNYESRGQIAADRKAIAENLNKVSLGLDEVVSNRNQIEIELEKIRKHFEQSNIDRESIKQSHLEISSKASVLQKLVESNSGLSDGTLALKEKLSKQITGFLFDAVSLHKDDENILENCMPHLFQSAIVENTDDFIEIVDKVEELSISKVTLFIKDLITSLSPTEELEKNNIISLNGIRCVGDRLENCKWQTAKKIFDRIFICQDEWILLKAKKICQNSQHFIFVTERGTISNGVYGLSCGQLQEGASQGILQRRREYAEVLEQKEKMQEKLANIEGHHYSLTEKKKKIESKVSELASVLEKEKVESVKLSSQLDNFDLQLRHIDENLARLDEDKQRLQAEILEAKESFAKNQGQIERLDSEFNSLQRDLDDFESDFSEKKETRDEILTQLQSKKSERAVILERQTNNRKYYEEMIFQIKRMQQKVESFISQIDELETKINNGENEFESLNLEINNFQKQVKIFEDKLEFLVQEESENSEELRVYESKLKSQKDSAASKQKFINDKLLELARYETIIETALKDAHEKYNIAPTDIPFDAPNDQALRNQLETRIKELQTAIQELGAVNERALEEFKDVSERLEFLTTQKTDIERSMQELYLSIQEIEENTKVRFKEIFDKVNIEFQKIFPVLFPSGYGELHMLNDQDLLNTGVEILVRLPGKKMQNMSLFSGGEKALTAISLIFSLLKTTPAPFCFLDEVDAPLDEANVGRFNDVLDALSNEFQFVVITHNRRTMEVLDTIYGISMSEPGVSKLVSVDLSDVPTHLRKKQKAAIRTGASVSL